MRGYLLGQIVTHIHTCAHIYARDVVTWMQKRNGNKSHTQKGKFVIISKEYQKQKNRQNKEQKHICFTFAY